ncbi:MAG: hypothetical protein JW704_04955 [Anaerolineaceae bacterium]|nr:hypothetical protein [Anaerolineaceae bacterium]MBN2676645.1 hypothetical protein [Anaerolineaceae bacterium]
MPYLPLNFIGEKIEPDFIQPPIFGKRPGCPDGFSWRGENYRIVKSFEQWVDFTRCGRRARNMSTEHAEVASRRGSWGVGRYHFHVCVESGRIFHIYYDRAPKDIDDCMGEWFLVSELVSE